MEKVYEILTQATRERMRKELRELEIVWLKELANVMNWDYEKIESQLNSDEVYDWIIDEGGFEEYEKQIGDWINIAKEEPEYLRELLKDVVPY